MDGDVARGDGAGQRRVTHALGRGAGRRSERTRGLRNTRLNMSRPRRRAGARAGPRIGAPRYGTVARRRQSAMLAAVDSVTEPRPCANPRVDAPSRSDLGRARLWAGRLAHRRRAGRPKAASPPLWLGRRGRRRQLVALGGDGFMLQTLHAMLESGDPRPVFGMNRGTVGFLMNEWRLDRLGRAARRAPRRSASPR